MADYRINATLADVPAYLTSDGDTFRADSPEELVEALREASRTPSLSPADFMEAASRRARLQTGAEIRTDSAALFVADLIAAGLLILGS